MTNKFGIIRPGGDASSGAFGHLEPGICSLLPDYQVDIIKSSLGREINKLIISEFVTIANNYNLKIS